MSDLLADALGYAERGLSIIPTKGKIPTIRAWTPYAVTPATSRQLRQWYTSNRPDGVAVICGDVSGGLVCRDFDVMDSYSAWAESHPNLAETLPTSETTRGRHVYFRYPLRRIVILDDGELRGKGYCLLPRSKPGPKAYRWVNPLPDGPLPIIDPFEAGLALGVTERTEKTERTEDTEENRETEAISEGALISLSVSNEVAQQIQEAIISTLPKGGLVRNGLIFEFARALKAIPAIADADLQDFRDVVRQWHKLALPVIGTKPFDDTWADFVYGWPRVKFPKGSEPMNQILANADASELPVLAGRYDCPRTHRLIKLCREFQRAAGDGPFFLSCRTAGELLGVDHNTAWKRLRMLESDDVLKATARGTKTRATRYMYTAPI